MKRLGILMVVLMAIILVSCHEQTKSQQETDQVFTKGTKVKEAENKHSHDHGDMNLGFDPSVPQVTKLADNVYSYSQFFYNGLIIITNDGVIVTDPAGEPRAKAMREEIKKLTNKPIIKVVYSHDHYDHTKGGQLFKDEGARFISHENALDLITRSSLEDIVVPDVTYKDKMSIELDNGSTLDLLYYGRNDGDAMTVMYLPKEKILYAVDFHTPGMLVEPFRLVTLNYSEVYRTLKRVKEDLEFDIVISGHAPVSNSELYDMELKFVESLYNKTLEGLKAGKTTEQLMEELKFPEIEHWMGYEKNLPGHIQRMAYSIWHGN